MVTIQQGYSLISRHEPTITKHTQLGKGI
jgi:hypothetical protein